MRISSSCPRSNTTTRRFRLSCGSRASRSCTQRLLTPSTSAAASHPTTSDGSRGLILPRVLRRCSRAGSNRTRLISSTGSNPSLSLADSLIARCVSLMRLPLVECSRLGQEDAPGPVPRLDPASVVWVKPHLDVLAVPRHTGPRRQQSSELGHEPATLRHLAHVGAGHVPHRPSHVGRLQSTSHVSFLAGLEGSDLPAPARR